MKQIPLTQGYVALVDDADYEELSNYNWHARIVPDSVCAVRNTPRGKDKKRHKASMHRQIMSATKGMQVDHVNHDTLDNRRVNLRLCTQSQNNANQRKQPGRTSRFKGVCRRKQARKWRAEIIVLGRAVNLGSFDSEIEAAQAYNRAATTHFGEFAYLNAT